MILIIALTKTTYGVADQEDEDDADEQLRRPVVRALAALVDDVRRRQQLHRRRLDDRDAAVAADLGRGVCRDGKPPSGDRHDRLRLDAGQTSGLLLMTARVSLGRVPAAGQLEGRSGRGLQVKVLDVDGGTDLNFGHLLDLVDRLLSAAPVVVLPELGRVPDLRVDAVVEEDERQKRQNSGHENFGPVSAEHDVPLVPHDVGRHEGVLVFARISLVDLLRPELKEPADVDRHGGRKDQNDEESRLGLVLQRSTDGQVSLGRHGHDEQDRDGDVNVSEGPEDLAEHDDEPLRLSVRDGHADRGQHEESDEEGVADGESYEQLKFKTHIMKLLFRKKYYLKFVFRSLIRSSRLIGKLMF